MRELLLDTPRVFQTLLEPARYKAIYGGRGSGKSHFSAEMLIEDHLAQPGLRSVCIREVQKSLKESSKRLIEDKLTQFGLGFGDGFQVLKDEIRTPGRGIIAFAGMQDHTAESIKSLEGFQRAWVEEAQTLSKRSLKMLTPTIRAPGSQLWFTWNPTRESDAVDAFFRGAETPSDAIIVRANWSDNPWFHQTALAQERLDALRMDPAHYPHIWEGEYATVVEGAYFAKELIAARAERRIGYVAADPLLTYRAFVDIGGTGKNADAFAVWVCQFVGREVRVVNYHEAVGQPLAFHLEWLREQKYTPANLQFWLPHDGATHDKVFAVSYQSALESAGFSVEVVPNQGKGAAISRIQASRRIFPACQFNEATTKPGVEALGAYHERRDTKRDVGLGPLHDWASHGADAFGLMAIVAEDHFRTASYGRSTVVRRRTSPMAV